jgi:hypothetical protein
MGHWAPHGDSRIGPILIYRIYFIVSSQEIHSPRINKMKIIFVTKKEIPFLLLLAMSREHNLTWYHDIILKIWIYNCQKTVNKFVGVQTSEGVCPHSRKLPRISPTWKIIYKLLDECLVAHKTNYRKTNAGKQLQITTEEQPRPC